MIYEEQVESDSVGHGSDVDVFFFNLTVLVQLLASAQGFFGG